MMKNIKLLFQIFVSIIVVFSFLISIKVNATISTTSSVSVIGAQIRTDEFEGIKFVANTTYTENVKEYGVLVALGEVDINDIVVNGSGVFGATVKSIDEDNNFYLTIFNFPEKAYVMGITARAYLILEDNSIVYADTVTTKSLAEISLKAANLGVTGEFIDKIIQYVDSNYNKMFTDSLENVFIDSSIYESDSKKLYKEFAKDWNKKFNTELTGNVDNDLFTNQDVFKNTLRGENSFNINCNLYQFFKEDESTSIKWNWLLNYIYNETSNNEVLREQIDVILGNTDTITDEIWNQGLDIVAMLGSYFGQTNYNIGAMDSEFDINWYSKTLNYNNKVYATNHKFHVNGKQISLSEEGSQVGYTISWYLNSTIYMEDIVTVDANVNYMFVSQKNLIDFKIEYYNGETLIDDMENTTYNVESETIILKSYEIRARLFENWYDNPEFTGEPINEIPKGSTGNKKLYAKYVDEVTVTFNPNGGLWSHEELKENTNVDMADVAVTNHLTFTGNGTEASLENTPKGGQWYFIVLESTEVEGLYMIYEVVFTKQKITSKNYEYLIMWTDPLENNDPDTYNALMEIYDNGSNKYAGQCVYLGELPSTESEGIQIDISITNSDFDGIITTPWPISKILPTGLYRQGYTFAGWYTNPEFTGDPVTTISEDSVLYAKWIEN